MACECPVITTHRRALEEVAGDAAMIISGTSVEETGVALMQIRQERLRQDLIRRGLERVQRFTWEPMIECILDRVHD
jgi:glycosyltransferase involved in cell wall biosynthesis